MVQIYDCKTDDILPFFGSMYVYEFDSSLLQCAMECAFKKENLVSNTG